MKSNCPHKINNKLCDMKSILKASGLILLILSFFLICSCKKKTAPPVITTTEVTEITDITAVSGGNITDDGGASITARGVCWSISQNPTIADNKTENGTGTGIFTSSVSGLAGMATYYIRAYATNSTGTSYGDEISFKTFAVTDADGNGYSSVTLGSQIWMAENLKVMHYSNNDLIPNLTDNAAWSSLLTGACCDYNNIPDTSKIYGKLYNFYAVADARNLCPNGWHVPSDAEWTILTNFLGGESIAGGKMKEIGLVHWNSPNTGATNESGFTALAAGQRTTDGTFSDFGIAAIWWSSTPYNNLKPYYRSTGCGNVIVFRGYGTLNNVGMSIRCLKN